MNGIQKVILTNDDGIHAEGINALANALRETFDVVVIAPLREHSECGHSVTTRRPLTVDAHGNGFAVLGTPADCVRLALCELATDATMLISGINHGGNLGADIWMSGTVAAAREAHMRGVPAIAVSQYRRADVELTWNRAAELAMCGIKHAMRSTATGKFWNINLPAIDKSKTPKICECEVDSNPMPLSYETTQDGYRFIGSYQDRPRKQGSDIDLCFEGNITLSQI